MIESWQPLIDAGAAWALWPPWKYLVFALIVWHVMIGRQTAVRWMEALGWNGVMGFFARIGWITEPPAAAERPQVEQTKVSTLVRP